jgi:hypothetical protein
VKPPARPPRGAERPVRAGGGVVLGVLLLARGRAEGFRQFGDSAQAFLSSLAPLVAFPLVGAALLLVDGVGLPALSDFLGTICALLVPPVLSQALAQAWGRDAAWLRYATAFNWCQWAVPLAAAACLLLVPVAEQLGLPPMAAARAAVAAVVGYALWLQWFLARRGLALGVGRAAALVLMVNAGTALLALGPRLLAPG